MTIVERRLLHRGRKFDLAVNVLRAAAGETIEREYVDHPGAVVVLPLLDDGRVVLLRNYRHALDDWLWELPAGTRERCERPEATARRELLEEAGFRAGRLQQLLEFYPAPGISNEAMTAFVAEDLEAAATARELDEAMEVHFFSAPAALEMADVGIIRDGKSLVTLWAWRQRLSTQ